MKNYLECLDEAAVILKDPKLTKYLKMTLSKPSVELLEKAAEIYASQSNSHKHSVSGKQPESETIQAAAFDYATKMSTAPDKETPDWIIQDFKAGAKWALSQVACASGAVDKTVSDGKQEQKQNLIDLMKTDGEHGMYGTD